MKVQASLMVAIATLGVALPAAFAEVSPKPRKGPPGPSQEIVVALRDRIAVVSADDGHVIRTIADGTIANVGDVDGVSVTPRGNSIVFTQAGPQYPAGSRCLTPPPRSIAHSSQLAEMPTGGGAATTVVPFADSPLVSPDGRWVAYVIPDLCLGPSTRGVALLGVTKLATGSHYRPYEHDLQRHPAKMQLLAWSPRSDRLLFNVLRPHAGPHGEDQWAFVLRRPPLGHGDTPARLRAPGMISAATFLPDGKPLVALAHKNSYEVVALDAAGHVVAAGSARTPCRATRPQPPRSRSTVAGSAC